MATASRSIVVDVEPEILFGVITDYESYSDFLPEMQEAQVLSTGDEDKGGTRIVEVAYRIKVVKEFSYTLEMTETPYEGVRWEQTEGIFKRNEGGWSLKSLGKDQTEATYEVTIELGFWAPKSIQTMLVGSSLPSTLKRFKEQAEGLAG